MSHYINKKSDHELYLAALEGLAKEMGFHGMLPEEENEPHKASKVTPSQLLRIQAMMGEPKRLTTLLTLGAQPQSAYPYALAFQDLYNDSTIVEILEAHGAKKSRKPLKPSLPKG